MSTIPFSENKLRFGKYKDKPIKDVPDDYLLWCVKNNALKGKLLYHTQLRLNLPRNKYAVTVTDSGNNKDGTYVVYAYNKTDAINTCERQYGIYNTSSMHGTEYDVKEIP